MNPSNQPEPIHRPYCAKSDKQCLTMHIDGICPDVRDCEACMAEKQNDSPKEVASSPRIYTSNADASSMPDAQAEVGLRDLITVLFKMHGIHNLAAEVDTVMSAIEIDKATAVAEARRDERKLFSKALYKHGIVLPKAVHVLAELPELTHLQPPTAGEGESGETS